MPASYHVATPAAEEGLSSTIYQCWPFANAHIPSAPDLDITRKAVFDRVFGHVMTMAPVDDVVLMSTRVLGSHKSKVT